MRLLFHPIERVTRIIPFSKTFVPFIKYNRREKIYISGVERKTRASILK